MKKILFVTDLYYNANGRRYYEEDLFITSKLRDEFKLVICNPKDMDSFNDEFDLTIFRNAGPVANFPDEYNKFRNKIKANNLKTYNSFDGKGDMNGKDYLLELTNLNYPVIKTIDRIDNFDKLPNVDKYVIKPKDGADSIGMEIISKDEVYKKVSKEDRNTLIQPAINFEYEVSFYFIDKDFQYALYAPDKSKRWELKEYKATKEDLEFANKFIEWNNIDHGIQRIDACRDENGELLLVELEDLNPYLSVLELSSDVQDKFIKSLVKSVNRVLEEK
ncbi:hypothetical protein [Romboutsia lituseburensis]|uniref:Glutathione synthase/RimK-type ligase, ATP-grasp superfamily n=1 Tax=Romboutsia lituseburensis DSM 797 TaxID=1121325 RepID=A0A1G9JGZ2_9FIRM|nr:hypothetical protein [Romboutsia lituseburensis]CEH33495.1 Pyruvate phosphate dikinase, PEP/pyruvate-binding [Romboutsia lituseburensis]SDL36728.1 hypothetical protein SAMN04515677_101646 [Romboutsia lituseburensis DSM 797]